MMSELCTRCWITQTFTAGAKDRCTGALIDTCERQIGNPARFWAGSIGSGGAGHALDGTGVVRRHDRRDGQNRLLAHGAETQDERNQGEHLNLKFWIAAAQHVIAKWLSGAVAANAIGSIVIAGNEHTAAFSGRVVADQRLVRHG